MHVTHLPIYFETFIGTGEVVWLSSTNKVTMMGMGNWYWHLDAMTHHKTQTVNIILELCCIASIWQNGSICSCNKWTNMLYLLIWAHPEASLGCLKWQVNYEIYLPVSLWLIVSSIPCTTPYVIRRLFIIHSNPYRKYAIGRMKSNVCVYGIWRLKYKTKCIWEVQTNRNLRELGIWQIHKHKITIAKLHANYADLTY